MKKTKYIVNISIVALLLFASITIYLLYPTIKNTVTSRLNNSQAIMDYANMHLEDYNYIIDLNIKKKSNQDTSLKQYITKKQFTEDTYSADLTFIDEIEREQESFRNQKDFEYYAIDTKNNQILSNSKENLSSIDSDDKIKDKYQWYIQFIYDEAGKLNIKYVDDYSHRWSDSIDKTLSDYSYHDDTTEINISNPKNLTITYAVPKILPEYSGLAEFIDYASANHYLQFSIIYILMVFAGIFIVTLIIPFKYLKESSLFDTLAKIKFEFLATFWVTSMLFLTKLSSALIYFTSTTQFSNFLNDLGVKQLEKFFIPVINLSFWFVLFLLVMLLGFMIKYLFDKGIKRYCIENTFVGWIFVHSERLLNKITDFDFNNNTNRIVLKIVIFNFIIITIISFFFVFGLFFSLLYSIIIFCIIKSKFTTIQKDYQVLLDASRQLSDGNFDVQIQRDVGVFNPLKDEFSHIKSGFEKAVKEEVKSQKTKTELISNVSHDLKTPLTSIITYIDLLKGDSLSEEDRMKYIQILDRNSLRLKHLIEDLFEVSKASSGDIKLNYAQVDIVALIKQVQYECSDKLEEKGLDLRTNFSADRVICTLDGEKTYRIFENLFMNISKYALAHTRVYIDIHESIDSIEVTFKNISETEMRFSEKDIVERFVQGDESRNASGSGLGLAIVKSFTEIQQGQFIIELDGDLFKSILIFKK